MLAIVRDTTAQREIEAQMHQSEKLTALGQMAGGIAHDFNNLLQAILGYAQLMGKNPANVEVVRRGLDVIEKAANGRCGDGPPHPEVRAPATGGGLRRARPRPGRPRCPRDHAPALGGKEDQGGVPLQLELELGPVPW